MKSFDSRLFTAVTSEMGFATLVSECWVYKNRHNIKIPNDKEANDL